MDITIIILLLTVVGVFTTLNEFKWSPEREKRGRARAKEYLYQKYGCPRCYMDNVIRKTNPSYWLQFRIEGDSSHYKCNQDINNHGG